MSIRPFAFVLMPFDKSFDDIYKLGIQAAAEDAGIVAERVDEQIYSEGILERIYRQIKNADFIIADMTGRNPNVFYEVGYAHAHEKPCTLLTQSANDIPFDLLHHRHIVYESSIKTLKEKLSQEFKWHKDELSKRKIKPISVDLKSAEGDLSKNDWSAVGTMDLVLDLHNKTEKRSPDIDAIYLYTKNTWKFTQDGQECPSTAAGTPEAADRVKHFVKAPIPRLAPGAWAQVKLSGARTFWTKWSGEDLKSEYTASGNLLVEMTTSEGAFQEILHLQVKFEEVPF